MDEMIAYCGLMCHDCPTIKAHQENDTAAKKRIAAHWAEVYPAVFPEGIRWQEVTCDGCKSDGVRFFVCRDCKIRACARERGHSTCAACPEYESCQTMADYFLVAPEVKPVLDALRQGRDYHGYNTFK